MNFSEPVWKDEATQLRTGCKINLFLNICNLRPDGYHELQTLFYDLPEPFDVLYIRPLQEGAGLKLVCPQLPKLENEKTTIHKALDAFNNATGQDCGYEIFLNKTVPVGAGLGGGSANAAGFLQYLNLVAAEKKISNPELIKVGAKVGADVPFFLMEGPALAEGIGEKLTSKKINLAGFYLVLICPGVHISTPWAYKEWDRLKEQGELKENSLHTYFYQLLTSDERTDKNIFSSGLVTRESNWPWFYNNLELAVFPAHPEIAAIKERLFQAGARVALMSGSGSSVFGLFDNQEEAQIAAGLKFFKGSCSIVQALRF